jgi:hypothetical protein
LKSAEKFYDGKVEELGANLKDLELIVQRKQTNARTVEEGEFINLQRPPFSLTIRSIVLRQKLMAQGGQS